MIRLQIQSDSKILTRSEAQFHIFFLHTVYGFWLPLVMSAKILEDQTVRKKKCRKLKRGVLVTYMYIYPCVRVFNTVLPFLRQPRFATYFVAHREKYLT